MGSFEIRQKIKLVLIRILWTIGRYKTQPTPDDLILFNLGRLKELLKYNFKTHYRLSQLFETLKQLDMAWSTLGVMNPKEADKKRMFIRKHGDYAVFYEACGEVTRESKKVYEYTVLELMKRYPDVNVPLRISSD